MLMKSLKNNAYILNKYNILIFGFSHLSYGLTFLHSYVSDSF